LLFNNKIYDITNCTFVEPSPEQYINISTGYNYDDNYDDKLVDELDKFISTIFNNDIKK
jgi:hypothetical protein